MTLQDNHQPGCVYRGEGEWVCSIAHTRMIEQATPPGYIRMLMHLKRCQQEAVHEPHVWKTMDQGMDGQWFDELWGCDGRKETLVGEY